MKKKLSLFITMISILLLTFSIILCSNASDGNTTSATDLSYCKVKYYEDITNYRNNPETIEDYLFAGWFKEETCDASTYLKKSDTSGPAYAKYVPKDILGLKVQVTKKLWDDDTTNDNVGAIRFVTSVDSKDYSQVGFIINIGGADNYKANKYVYKQLYGEIGSGSNTKVDTYVPSEMFHSKSEFFKTYTVQNISELKYLTEFDVTPYWYTLDGTMVKGDMETVTVNQLRQWDYVFVDDSGEATVTDDGGNTSVNPALGTRNYPYKTLEDALNNMDANMTFQENAGDKGVIENYSVDDIDGTVYILNKLTADSNFVWDSHKLNVSIQGDKANKAGVFDLSAISTLNIGDGVTFENMTLTLPTSVYAWGNRMKIAKDVDVLNTTETPVSIYGGGNGVDGDDTDDDSVERTDVTLLTGTYKTIFGGGNEAAVSKDTNLYIAGDVKVYHGTSEGNYETYSITGGGNKGNVGGNTNVYVGGNVNAGLTYTSHAGLARLFGGCFNATVTGDTNVIVEGNALFTYIFGGGNGASSVVNGQSNVYFRGSAKAMSVYAGSRLGKSNAGTFVEMSGDTWVEQVFGGSEEQSVKGNTNVQILGGTVNRRVYGGCYNNAEETYSAALNWPPVELAMTWADKHYYVDGYSSVTIADANSLVFDYTKSVTKYNYTITSAADNSLYAFSRDSGVQLGETGVMIFNNGQYESCVDKIGYENGEFGDLGLDQYFSTSYYDYLVIAQEGGEVYSTGDGLRIIPDSGKKATVRSGSTTGDVLHYTESDSVCFLPELTSDTMTIYVLFEDTTPSDVDISDCEARIDSAYYDTLEEAVNATNVMVSEDTTIVTLLKNVEVESTMTISSDVTIQNEAESSITVYRGTGIAAANMFDVKAAGSLTVQGVETADSLIFDGRTKTEAEANTGIDDAAGSSASLINNNGNVNLSDVTVQYVKRTKVGDVNGNGSVIYNQGTSFTASGCTFSYNNGTEGGVIWSNQHYTVDGCTFTENSSTTYGGVILNRSTANIKNSTFQSNQAGSEGGVISTIATTGLTIENCDFIENSATVGGAIRTNTNAITITIDECEFRGNSATSGSGGAMYINTSTTVTITGSTFQSNTSSTTGGAIYTKSTKMTTIEGCNFTTNSANYGGAICTPNTTSIEVTIDGGCEFIENSASNSGGAINFGDATTGTIMNTVFEGNEAPTAGAITVATGGKASFADCEFKDNKNTGSTYQGDDVRLGGDTCVIEISGKFVGNVHNRNTSTVKIVGALTEGSAIELDWNTGSSFEAIRFVDAQGNANENAEEVEANQNYIQLGELTFNRELELKFEGTTGILQEWGPDYVATVNVTLYESLTDAVNAANEITSEGTTVVTLLKNVVVESKMTISGNVTIQNKAERDITLYRGKGLEAANMFAVNAGGSLTIKENETSGSLTIDGRTKEEADANTGIDAVAGSSSSLINNKGTLNLNDITVQYVKCNGGNGAVIYNQGTSFTASGCIFSYNSGKEGGVIWSNKYFTVDECEFNGNSSTNYGGAILNRSNATITNSTFQSNQTVNNGGAIHTNETTELSIEGCTFTGNSGKGGGAISTTANTKGITIDGCEFIENISSATNGGGAILLGSAITATITDTLFEGNQSPMAGAITVPSGGSVSFADCEFKDNQHTGDAASYQGNDVRLGGDSCVIEISGKFVGNVNHRNSSKVQIVGALTEGSVVELDWYDRRTHSTPEPNYFPIEAILFVDAQGNANENAEEVEANQNYIQLGEYTFNQGLELEYEGTTGTVVVDTNVVSVNGTLYESFTDAVNAANAITSEDTTIVTLLKNVVVESKMTISGNVTIQNKTERDITLYRGEGLAAANMFAVNAGGSLTIKENETSGSLTIDGRTKEEADANTGIDAVAGSSSSLINNKGTLNLNDITVQYVKCNGGNGAVIYNQGTSFTASGCIFSYNSGKEGGVIWSNKYFTVDECEFNGNSSTNYGGAILNRSNATITNSTFQSNQTVNNGGAIHTNETTELSIEGCTFTGNSGKGGGAISTTANTKAITIDGCEFIENISSATNGGGAILLGSAITATITDTLFEGNQSPMAGAITVPNGGSVSFADCEFKDNQHTGDAASYQGNDVRLGGATCVIEISGKFIGNVYNRNSSKVQIVGALTEGSAVELDWYTPNLTLPLETSVTFANSEVETASISYIQLGELTIGYGCELVDSATENALDLKN